MEKEKRLIKHTFKTTEAEAETIRRKMKSLGIRNESAYMRAMALNGYILKLDLPQIREMLRLLRNMTNNLNQISKRLNAHGQMYETEIEEVQQKLFLLCVVICIAGGVCVVVLQGFRAKCFPFSTALNDNGGQP